MDKIAQKATFVQQHTERRRAFRWLPTACLLGLAAFTSWSIWNAPIFALLTPTSEPNFAHLAGHCSPPPIAASAYSERLSSVASTLSALNASAYILEPGPNALYYANVSNAQWHLSERPLLIVITAEAKVSVITPKFESTRARLLAWPYNDEITFIEWAEADSPYKATLQALPAGVLDGGTVFVDEMARMFIPAGLQVAAPDMKVLMAPAEVKALRERKSPQEIEIMQCANELTLLAIREVRKHFFFGMRESDGRALVSQALSQAGLSSLDNIVLFGENAALPHGSGTNRVLTKADFVLIDCGGALHGYMSDVTRTFALPGSEIPKEHLEVWYNVQTAQQLALSTVREGVPALAVDAAARGWLTRFSLGEYFTHRLGHGIGLEVHESPYLLSSNEQLLESGNTFSDEPGVYIEGKVGVRLEDCFLVVPGWDTGLALTEGAGGLAKSPWEV